MPVADDDEVLVAPPRVSGETRVRMLVVRSGLRNGQDWPPPGGEIDVYADEAARFVRDGVAELVRPEPKPEPEPEPEPEEQATAPEEPVEKAVVPRRRPAHTSA